MKKVGRPPENRGRILYVRVSDENYKYLESVCGAKSLSLFMDRLISSIKLMGIDSVLPSTLIKNEKKIKRVK